MKKQLRKPENWEDFESLCKKLWGEIWECKEIKKNGRKGQAQNGVDVYGIPKGEVSYYGIQCKGKDEYTHKQLSKKEIDKELELVKSFKPSLAKLYFATTANKDSKVEEYVRIKDLENRKKGLFEIHLFSWEDIVDLIDDNRETHNWYLNLQKYKGTPEALVSFGNDEKELIGSVPFCNKYTHYVLGPKPTSLSEFTNYNFNQSPIAKQLSKGENKSYFRFRLKILNRGSVPIENPKLLIQLEGEYQDVGDQNIDTQYTTQKVLTDLEIDKLEGKFSVVPQRSTIAPREEYLSSYICIKPELEGSDISLNWKLVSNFFSDEGSLNLKIDTYFFQKDVNEYVDFNQLVRVEKSTEDCFKGDEESI